MNADPNCIFCKIVAGQIPSRKAFEDEDVLVFHDIHPWAPVHLLIIPKEHIATHADVTPEHERLLGKMLLLVPKLAKEHGADNGFRTIINTGRDGGQEVLHLHMHVIGGPRPWKQG
ncbi:MAG TPA: histidine triad nucleotide-binding protein [Burkholderiaceae bacterium]|jgi:histidine triad (HIT) family protein|nr:histidine triad nucleotide-binding protein [Burkholderiaceae bacterium]